MYATYRTTYDKQKHLKKLLFSSLFNLLTILDLVYKDLGRLKTGDKMFFNNQRSIPGNVPCNLPFPLFVYETAKATDIDVVAVRHGIFHHTEESLYGCRHVSLIHSSLFGDFVYYICFSHFVYF